MILTTQTELVVGKQYGDETHVAIVSDADSVPQEINMLVLREATFEEYVAYVATHGIKISLEQVFDLCVNGYRFYEVSTD